MNVTRRSNTSRHRHAARISATARCRFRAVARILVVLVALSFATIGGTFVTAVPAMADSGICGSGTSWPGFKWDGPYPYGTSTLLPIPPVPSGGWGTTVQYGYRLTLNSQTDPCTNNSSGYPWSMRWNTGSTIQNDYDPQRDKIWRITDGTGDSSGWVFPPWPDGYGPAPDTSAPTEPTVTLTAVGDDVRATWTGATDDVGVTKYRYRFDDAMDTGTWTAWSALVPVDMADKTLPHSIEVQAGDDAGNWSGSGLAVWGGCTTTDVSACSPVVAPGSGANANAYCADAQTPSSADWHCIYWGQPTPERPVHSATFNVRDFGLDMAAKDSVNVIVGWSCLPTGADNADSSTEPASEGVATFRGQQERNFAIDCGSDWIGSFYVLGGSKPSGGWNKDNDTTGTPADWQHVTLWWSYGIPGTLDDPNSDSYVPSPAPVPTSGPSPHPTVNYPNDPTDTPETSDSDGGTSSCAFHWYDPTSYMCGVLNILKSLLDFVRGIEQMIIRVLKLVFIPTGSQMSAWKTSVSGISNSGVFSLLGTMSNFVTGTFTSAQSPQACTVETSGSYTDGHSTVTKTSPIHYCQIITNAGDEMQSSDWGSKIYLGSKIILCFLFALLWFNRISATSGSQMSI